MAFLSYKVVLAAIVIIGDACVLLQDYCSNANRCGDGECINVYYGTGIFTTYACACNSGQYLVGQSCGGGGSSTSGKKCGSASNRLTNTSGVITSPGYDGSALYKSNLNCQWTIVTAADSRIRIVFNDLSIEPGYFDICYYDYVRIMKGSPAKTVETFCGSNRVKPLVLDDLGGQVVVRFVSDSSVGYEGFSLTYTVLAPCEDNEFACANGDCISASGHCNGIKECDNDESFCPIQLPFSCDFESTTNLCFINQFDTETLTWQRYSGETPSSYTGPSGDSSPDGSGYYAYTETSYGSNGMLSLGTILLETADHTEDLCIEFDYNMNGQDVKTLSIVNATYLSTNYTVAEVFLKISGNQKDIWKHGQVNVSGTENFAFAAERGFGYFGDIAIDNIAVKRGFCTPPAPVTYKSCRGRSQFDGVSDGSIKSDQFDGTTLYKANLRCFWKIFAGRNQVFRLTFSHFNVENSLDCRFDYLAIYTADTKSANDLYRRLCGPYAPLPITIGPSEHSGAISIEFVTDETVHGTGFSLNFAVRRDCQKEERCNGVSTCSDGSDEFSCGDNCGRPVIAPVLSDKSGQRIVGGNESRPGSWPWQMLLLYSGFHICGGVLIKSSWALTAAHCVVSFDKEDMLIVAGKHNKHEPERSEQKMPITSIYVHEEYNYFTNDYDIALLKLTGQVTMNDRAIPACLAQEYPWQGRICYITGWGETERTGHEEVLNQAAVPIYNVSKCNSAYGNSITPRMVCAGYEEGGIDSCYGDSGGPLVCETEGQWFLHGLTSFGSGCAKRGKPGVYSNVFTLRQWIEDKITEVDGA